MKSNQVLSYVLGIIVIGLSLLTLNTFLKKLHYQKLQKKESVQIERQQKIQNNVVEDVKLIIENITTNKQIKDSLENVIETTSPSIIEVEKTVFKIDPVQDSLNQYLESQLEIQNTLKYDTIVKVEKEYIKDTIVIIKKDTVVIKDTVVVSKKQLKNN